VPTRLQLEARVLAIFDAVRTGGAVEDGLVELKADWPDPQSAARKLAAHANSARGEDVLWVVGLDESSGLHETTAVEVADWWPQVRSCFDEVAPTLTDLVVHTGQGRLHALLFDTSLSPFVIKNSMYGKPGAGPVEREIPWRDGTAVRTARRSDLIRLLAPAQKLPEIEVLSASARARVTPGDDYRERAGDTLRGGEHLMWYFRLEMYAIPAVGTLAVLPLHRTVVEFAVGDDPFVVTNGEDSRYYPPSTSSFTRGGLEQKPDSASVDATTSEAIVHLAGRVNFRTDHAERIRNLDPGVTVRLRFTVHPVHTERSVQLNLVLSPAPPENDGSPRWTFRE
jgi:hypothetical protein